MTATTLAGLTDDALGGAVRIFVREVLESFKIADDLRGEQIAELRAAGKRIVAGGQTGTYDDEGETSWQYTDHRTGEVLASGYSDLETMEAEIAKADPAGTWHHIDLVEGPDFDVKPGELPETLAELLVEWVADAGVEDLVVVTGLPRSQVVQLCDQPNS